MKKFAGILIAAFLFSGCMSAYVNRKVRTNPMTGETEVHIPVLLLDHISGETSNMFTGQNTGLNVTNYIDNGRYIEMEIGQFSYATAGLLVTSGSTEMCADDKARIKIDGHLHEITSVRDGGVVSQHNSTMRGGRISKVFRITDQHYMAFLQAKEVLIEYCGIVASVDADSLAQVRGDKQ